MPYSQPLTHLKQRGERKRHYHRILSLRGNICTPTLVITPVPGLKEGPSDREGDALAALAKAGGMLWSEEFCCCGNQGRVVTELGDVAVRLGVPESGNP